MRYRKSTLPVVFKNYTAVFKKSFRTTYTTSKEYRAFYLIYVRNRSLRIHSTNFIVIYFLKITFTYKRSIKLKLKQYMYRKQIPYTFYTYLLSDYMQWSPHSIYISNEMTKLLEKGISLHPR